MQLVHVENLLAEKPKVLEKILTGSNCDVMNIQLQKGETVPEHNAPNEVIVVCRKGVVKFPVEGKENTLKENSVILLAPKEKHSLEALEDAELVVIKLK